MTRNDVAELIKHILKENQATALRDQVDMITDDTSLIDDLALDSIQILELIVNLEDEFNIVCDAQELNIDLFGRFGDLVGFIHKKVE